MRGLVHHIDLTVSDLERSRALEFVAGRTGNAD